MKVLIHKDNNKTLLVSLKGNERVKTLVHKDTLLSYDSGQIVFKNNHYKLDFLKTIR